MSNRKRVSDNLPDPKEVMEKAEKLGKDSPLDPILAWVLQTQANERAHYHDLAVEREEALEREMKAYRSFYRNVIYLIESASILDSPQDLFKQILEMGEFCQKKLK